MVATPAIWVRGFRSPASYGGIKLVSAPSLDASRLIVMGAAAILGTAVAIAPLPALAAVQISGTPQNVRVEADDSSIGQVLAALRQEFHVEYAASANLDRQIAGIYQGPLQRVLARLLEGYDFVVKSHDGWVEVTVLGTRDGSSPAGVPTAAAPTAPSVAAQPAAVAATPPKTASPAPAAKVAAQAEPAPPHVAPSATDAMSQMRLADGAASELLPTPSSQRSLVPSEASGAGPALLPSTVALPVPTMLDSGPTPPLSAVSVAPPIPATVGSPSLPVPTSPAPTAR